MKKNNTLNLDEFVNACNAFINKAKEIDEQELREAKEAEERLKNTNGYKLDKAMREFFAADE